MKVKITNIRMIHDFPITHNYCIFPDLPMEFRPELAIQKNGGFVYKYDKK